MTLQFIDTNILLYAYDTGTEDKHETAAHLVTTLARSHEAVISVQVMQEFYVNAVHKIARPLTPEQACTRLEAFSRWYVHAPLPGDVTAAAQLSQRHQLSFWDAMMMLSAIRMKCDVVWTEDLNSGQTIEGVRICNPFEVVTAK